MWSPNKPRSAHVITAYIYANLVPLRLVQHQHDWPARTPQLRLHKQKFRSTEAPAIDMVTMLRTLVGDQAFIGA